MAGSAGAADAAKPLYALCGAYAPEMAALKQEFGVDPANGWTRSVVKGMEFWRGKVGAKEVVVCRTGVSMVNAAYQLQLALDHFPITHVLFAGVAGGTDPALEVGDVVIPEAWANHGEAAYLNEDGKGGYVRPEYLPPGRENFGMIFPTGTGITRAGATDSAEEKSERLELIPVDAELLAAARRAAPKVPPMKKSGRVVKVSVGGNGVASTVFLDNAKYREWIFKVWQARCTDMESAALAQVGYANRKPVLIIRGLSDLAGGQHGKNPIDDNELKVAEIAARVLHGVLDELE
ncbi:MAG: 5'-methylthioadenosine/S-adenosylhomocysteine nucleosidase [Undibacterium sp.]|nr:5'-methylthioadenosine/S-adenosylhomocysteine nucleosidase [Opitutaceae bacterium]